MGCYINPQSGTKEQWLEQNGIEVTVPTFEMFDKKDILVCLSNNGPFRAAAVIFDKREFDEFTRLDYPNPKRWFLVEQAKVLQVCPELLSYLR